MYQERLTPDQLLREIKWHCTSHYDNGWCDLVIETMDDADIRKVIGKAPTLRGAIFKLRKHWGPYAERRAEVASTAF